MMDQPRFIGGRVKGTQLAAAAFVLSLVLLLAVGGITVFVLASKTTNNSAFSSELHTALVENCEKTRTVLVEGIEGELTSVEDPRIPEIFPDVPKAVADRIIREGNQDKRDRIDKIRPSGCEAAYPAP